MGQVGSAMVRRLLAAGYEVGVYDVRPEAIESLRREGAQGADSLAALAADRDAILTSLPHPAVSEEVFLGEGGLISRAAPGTLLVEFSTVSPGLARRVGERAEASGVQFIDAGIAGGLAAIRRGESTIMAGGAPEAMERASAIFRTFGARVFHVGGTGTGMTIKVVNNAMSHANMVAICEAASMAIRAGIAPEVVYEVVSCSSGASEQLRARYRDRVLNRNFEAGMRVDLAYKDSELALELARETNVPTPVLNAAHVVYEWAKAAGLADQDYAAIIQLWERLLGFETRRTDE